MRKGVKTPAQNKRKGVNYNANIRRRQLGDLLSSSNQELPLTILWKWRWAQVL